MSEPTAHRKKTMLNKKIHVPRVLNTLFALFAICLTYSPIFAQHNPDSTEIQRRIVQRLHERFGRCWPHVDTNGVILGLAGDGLNINLTGQDPVERGYQFFERNADLFQLISARQDLRGSKSMNRTGRSGSISYGQMVNGIPVIGGGYIIHLIPDSTAFFKFYQMSGDFFPEARSINTTPAISQAYAESLALSDPEHGEYLNYVAIGGTPELIIDNIEGRLRLIWKINVQNGRYAGTANYWIDANTAEILKVESAGRR